MSNTTTEAPRSLLENVDVLCTDADREPWLKARQNSIGSSDAPAVLGVSPWGSALSVYADKLEPAPESEVEMLRWGRLLEPIILEEFGREIGKPVSRAGLLLRSRAHPWMTATLDGVLTDGGEIPVEAKNTSWGASGWNDGIPDHVQVQVQHQLAVTGAPYAYVVSLFFGNQLKYAQVDRNEAFIREVLLPTEEAFWKRLTSGEAPDPDSSESARAALKRLYPKDSGEIVTLPGEFIDLDLELVDLKARLKAFEDEKRGIENRFIAAIGAAGEAVLPNMQRYTYRTQERKGYVVEPTSFRVLRRKGGE